MKKSFKVLILFLLLALCIACGKKEPAKIEPFDLKDEYYEEGNISEIALEDLQDLIENKESFVVSVYLPGCSSCAAFREVLDEFIKDNKLLIYSSQIKDAKQTEIGDKIKYAPSFVVFKEGKVVAYLDAESNDDKSVYETVDNFKTWLTKYINLK